MFFQLQLIHLYRPFLKYTKSTTTPPFPPHVLPRRVCTQAALTISKLLRMYERTYGFRQICNIVVYITHAACTIHLLDLPDKTAQRDVLRGLKNLEEMAEGWPNARRSLRILDISINNWQIKLPPEAAAVFVRTLSRWGQWESWDQTASSSADDSPVIDNDHSTSTPRTNHLPFPEAGLAPLTQANASINGGATNIYSNPVTSAVPALFPIIGPDYQSAEMPFQQSELPPLEPIYSRPISYTGYQSSPVCSPGLPNSFPRSNPGYGTSAGGPLPRNHFFPSASSGTRYPNATNWGEESQDWYSRESAALVTDLAQWGDGWDPALASQLPQLKNDESGHGPIRFDQQNPVAGEK